MPIDPGDLALLLVVVTGCVSVLVPVVGFTARFALKPVVEAIVRIRDGQGSTQGVPLLERRMELLEQELQSLSGMRREVERLGEAQEFQMQLALPRSEGDSLA